MDRIISLLSPKNSFGFFARTTIFNALFLGAYTFLEFLHGHHADAEFFQHVFSILLVGVPVSVVGFALIGYLHGLQIKLAHLAMTDLLTNLPNRRGFLHSFESCHNGFEGILLVLDIDHFKRINDTYGHAVGDKCLRAMADHIRLFVRADDFVGRIGGEEFAIFLKGALIADVEKFEGRLTQGVHLVPSAKSDTVQVTISAGAAVARRLSTIDTLMQEADKALYQAKQNGRGRLVFGSQRSQDAVS